MLCEKGAVLFINKIRSIMKGGGFMAKKKVKGFDSCPNPKCDGIVSRGDSEVYGFCHGGQEACSIYLRIPSRHNVNDEVTIIKRLDGNGEMIPVTRRDLENEDLAVKKFCAALPAG